ncbi:MAG TPA: alpha/beta hydrolase-fold protein, partial [Kribbellaceae bacterium]
LGAVVTTVFTWDRARWKRARRVAALFTSQVLVVLTALTIVNSSQGFFTSWSDFSGATNARLSTTGPVHAGTSGSAPGQQLTAAVAAARKAVKPGRGVMASVTIAGARTGYRLPARIYFPAAYFDPEQSDRIFPVVMFFNGFLGSVDTFQRKLGADRVLDELIASGKMQATVAVVPEKNPHRPKDSECIDAVGGDRSDTYLSQDVPEVIKQELRVSQHRSGWAAMGYSTGGFCATNLALRHPDVFAAALNLSGNYRPYIDSTTGDLFRGDRAAHRANTPVHTITQPRTCPLSFYLFVSRGDPVASREQREFVPRVKAPDAVTIVFLERGGHNFGVWRRALPNAFTWVGRVLHAYGVGDQCPTAAPNPGAGPDGGLGAAPRTPPTGSDPKR